MLDCAACLALRMNVRNPSCRLRRSVVAVVLMALAFAQTLGLMHRIVHAPVLVAAGVARLHASAPLHGLQALFAGHGSDQGCHLYDQSSHPDLATVIAPVFALLDTVETPAPIHTSTHVAVQAAGFLARGPPLAG